MKTIHHATLLIFVLATSCFCQIASSPVPACMGGAGQPNAVIQPVAVPTSTTNVGSASDACLISITITNKSGGSLNFSLCDRQGTPVCAVAVAPIAANTTYILVWPVGAMYWCPGGFTILASGTGLTIEGNFRQ